MLLVMFKYTNKCFKWENEFVDDSKIPEIYYSKKSLKEKLKEKIKVFKTSQGERKEKDVKQDS